MRWPGKSRDTVNRGFAAVLNYFMQTFLPNSRIIFDLLEFVAFWLLKLRIKKDLLVYSNVKQEVDKNYNHNITN